MSFSGDESSSNRFAEHPVRMFSPDDTLFAYFDDWTNNACVNWRPGDWYLYAVGYRQAAGILADYIETNGCHQDTMVYPIVFLYRQYIEIMLKDTIRQAHILLELEVDRSKTHDINKLWNKCRKLMAEIHPEDSRFEIDQVTRLLQQLSAVDPFSTAFRYPVNSDGEPSLVSSLRHINVRVFREVMEKISDLLDSARCEIRVLQDRKWEMEQYREY